MAKFSITSQGGSSSMTIIRLEGEVAPSSFSLIDEEVNNVTDSNVRSLIFDVAELESVTSSVLGLFVATGRRLAARQGRVMLAAPSQKIKGIIALMGIGSELETADSVQEAQDLLAGP